MRKLALVALCASLALPHRARAESAVDPFLRPVPVGPPESGFTFGARAGYGAPLGKTSQGNDLSSTLSGSVPLQIDAGWRLNPNVYVGLYLQFGPAQLDSQLKQACDAGGVTCSSSDLRIGFDLVYAFLPRGRVAPWAGVGAGFETAQLNVAQGGSSAELTLKGLEIAHVTAGLDLRFWPAFRFGPFANCTLARYMSVDASVNAPNSQIGVTGSGGIENKAFHGWLQLGVRAAIDI